MGKTDNNYRVRTNIGQDTVLHVPLHRDIDFLEILTLKLSQKDLYKLHTSNYGVIVGRVLANDGFGIPNARISVFIGLDDTDKDNTDITQYYPYKYISSRDKEERRYNLLPDTKRNDCYRIVGTFPNKRLVLDDDTEIEIFDKYWKYTTVTNASGDYMIFGVPTGNQNLHVDIDLSNIGILSQKPRDFVYKGYDVNKFDNASQFKESTNLDDLVQIIGQNQSVEVYPFWGDNNANGNISISRCDINIAYKFETTCVFMGSIVSDDQSNSISHECAPSKKNGYNKSLTASEGTIEMIRQTQDGLVEEVQIQGNQLIDGDGIWCYQIPMNLDYVVTDEYGNLVPTDNPNKGIATRTSVRFRFSVNETGSEGVSRHRAEYLVPNNPMPDGNGAREAWTGTTEETKVKTPRINSNSWRDFEKNYEFGSATPNECFRSLYWNKVYTVKNYIPRIQANNKFNTNEYLGIRSTNFYDTNTPFPFNNVRFSLSSMYMFVCILMQIFFIVVAMINAVICIIRCIPIGIPGLKIFGFSLCWYPFKDLLSCIEIPIEDDEAGDGSVAIYAPGCWFSPPKGAHQNFQDYSDKMQRGLAQESEVVNFDFYNDWINGCLYMPLWFWKKQKKKKYFFGLFSSSHTNKFCNASQNVKKLYIGQGCPTSIFIKDDEQLTKNVHKKFSTIRLPYGVIYEKTNKDGLKIYYYIPATVSSTKGQNLPFIRMFATDIILLGSLADCDMDSIPKMFDKVPSTTANIPFLVSTKVYSDEETEQTNEITETTPLSITGLDWTRKEGKPPYKLAKGLLLDLACASVTTFHKSIINTRRLCELGVTFDSSYEKITVTSNNIIRREVEPDGLMTRIEIEDLESRSMFATLNHNGLETTVYSPITKYSTYKLEYLYPTEFDGYLSYAAEQYTKNNTTDLPSQSYLKFRFGTDGNWRWGYNSNFPMYNNSYYFFFGIKPGKTALEKFYKNFYSECYNNNKDPFTFDLETHAGAWCDQDASFKLNLNKIRTPYSITLTDNMGFDFINASELEYSELEFYYWKNDDCRYDGESSSYDAAYEFIKDETVGKEETMRLEPKDDEEIETAFYGTGVLEYETEETSDVNGKYVFFSTNLTNGVYTLTITDSYGRKLSQEVNLLQSPINLNIINKNLSDKYEVGKKVDVESSGKIVISSIDIDGEEYRIIEDGFQLFDSDKPFRLEVKVRKIKEEGVDADGRPNIVFDDKIYRVKIEIEPSNIEGDPSISTFRDSIYNEDFYNGEYRILQNFNCDYNTIDDSSYNDTIVGESRCLVFFPLTSDEFNITAMQCCNCDDSEECDSDNIYVGKIKISNSDPLNLKFAETDVDLIVPGRMDDFKGWTEISNPYYSDISGTKNGSKRFDFPDYKDETVDTWNNWVGGLINPNDGENYPSIISIIAFELNTVIKVAKAVACKESTTLLQFEYEGGSDPKLYTAYPDYSNMNSTLHAKNPLNLYIADDNTTTIQANAYYPIVVQENYNVNANALIYPYVLYGKTYGKNGWVLNRIFKTDDLGNYAGVIDMNNTKKTCPEGISALTIGNMYDSMTLIQPKDNYFNVDTVDRRLDYELQIGKTTKQVIVDKVYSRFYGGIALRYDDNKSIIDWIKEDDEALEKDTEYTYKISNGKDLEEGDFTKWCQGSDYKSLSLNKSFYEEKPHQWKRKYYDMLMYVDTDYKNGLNLHEKLIEDDDKSSYSFPVFKIDETKFLETQNLILGNEDETPTRLGWTFKTCDYPTSVNAIPIYSIGDDGEEYISDYEVGNEIGEGVEVSEEISMATSFMDAYDSLYDMLVTKTGNINHAQNSTNINNLEESKGIQFQYRIAYDNVANHIVYTTTPISIIGEKTDPKFAIDKMVQTIKDAYDERQNDGIIRGNSRIGKTSVLIPEDYSEDYTVIDKNGNDRNAKFVGDKQKNVRLPDDEELRSVIRYKLTDIDKNHGFYPAVRREYYDVNFNSANIARKLIIYELGAYVPKVNDGFTWVIHRLKTGNGSSAWGDKYIEKSRLEPSEKRHNKSWRWCYITVEIPLILEDGELRPDVADNPYAVVDDKTSYGGDKYLIGARVGEDFYLNAWYVGNVGNYAEFFIPFYSEGDVSEDYKEESVNPDTGLSIPVDRGGSSSDAVTRVVPKWYYKSYVDVMFKRYTNNLWYHAFLDKSKSGGQVAN